jgi:hypothetical protein
MQTIRFCCLNLIRVSYEHPQSEWAVTLDTIGEAFGPSFSGRRKNSSPESESGGPVPVESDHISVHIKIESFYKSSTVGKIFVLLDQTFGSCVMKIPIYFVIQSTAMREQLWIRKDQTETYDLQKQFTGTLCNIMLSSIELFEILSVYATYWIYHKLLLKKLYK